VSTETQVEAMVAGAVAEFSTGMTDKAYEREAGNANE
jgi:hypothetical protein